MGTTSASLLDRLKKAPPDSPDWRRLHDLYQPLIKYWLGRVFEVGDAVDDLVQEVLIVIVQELPEFQRQRTGSFRAWIREIAVNQARAHVKKRQRRSRKSAADPEAILAQLADPNSELAREWDIAHDRHVANRILELVRGDFEPTTWEAFTRFALDGKPAKEVADEIGISENAVLIAKSRVLKRMRREAGDIMS